jgi:hypothetical protein
MMFFARHFVSSGISRYFDRLKPTSFNQGLNVSVYRGDSDRRMMLLRRLESFFR